MTELCNSMVDLVMNVPPSSDNALPAAYLIIGIALFAISELSSKLKLDTQFNEIFIQ